MTLTNRNHTKLANIDPEHFLWGQVDLKSIYVDFYVPRSPLLNLICPYWLILDFLNVLLAINNFTTFFFLHSLF